MCEDFVIPHFKFNNKLLIVEKGYERLNQLIIIINTSFSTIYFKVAIGSKSLCKMYKYII